MSVEELVKLRRKRGSLKKRVTDFNKFLSTKANVFQTEGLERVALIEIECRLERMHSVLDEFQEIQNACDSLTIDEGEVSDGDERDSFETMYFSTIATAKSLLEEAAYTRETASVGSEHGNSARGDLAITGENIKLPPISLPHFSGCYTKWLEFRDTFTALVHSSEKISKIQKFYYLRSALDGDATKVIGSMEISASNYESAWSLLCERYENKRLLTQNHIRALFNLPNVAKETPAQLREMLDTVTQHLRALKSLGQPIEQWDAMLIFIISSKFDAVTAREWESEKSGNDLPSLQDMKDFLRKKADMLETLSFAKLESSQRNIKERTRAPSKVFALSNIACYYCKGTHTIYNCPYFVALSIEVRQREVKSRKLCANCLRPGHSVRDCKSGGCRRCRQRHSTLLHIEKQEVGSGDSPTVNLTAVQGSGRQPYCLLSTAQVIVMNARGKEQVCRVLLDSGSQSNFIIRQTAERLGLKIVPYDAAVSGLSNCTTTINGKCEITLNSRLNAFSTRIECLVIPHISDYLPQVKLDIRHWNIPDSVKLADPDFHKPGPLDILLGAGVFWNLMENGNFSLGPSKPTIQKTCLGWILSGPVSCQNYSGLSTRCNLSKTVDLQSQLARFWELEEFPTIKHMSEDEKACEAHFIDNYKRESDGRFVVSIPFKESIELLGDSKAGALKRFYSLERKLQSQPQLKTEYIKFMREFGELGHMTKVNDNTNDEVQYYMPHHGVINESSTTTKLRVVFDASYPSTSGYSLNSLQYVGPTIQSDLLSILLRFRQHTIAISADVTKMYRQVLINPKERKLQRIFWREDPSQPLAIYELNTVTYGTSTGSFLAIRCLQQLSIDNAVKYSEASTIIAEDFYVDDLLTGADDELKAITLCEQISSILEAGCLPLRKWLSNKPQVLERVTDSKQVQNNVTIGSNENTKTLGLYWASSEDKLVFNVNTKLSSVVTKRVILSIISQLFDPLGLVGPCTVKAKIFLQLIWQESLDWDDKVPCHIQAQWTEFRDELSSLNEIKIPRYAICHNSTRLELHGFADASERAYGACIYLRSEDVHGHVTTRILCSKSKVAPLKTITMPRLELCAALILAKLFEKVKASLRITFQRVGLWSDSQIILAWLRTPTSTLKIFVANRVAQIQECTDVSTWHYVPTASNPADLISRGLSPKEIMNASLWWNGPVWLSANMSEWPEQPAQYEREVPDLRPQTFTITTEPAIISITDFSNLNRMLRTIAYCLRFGYNARHKKHERVYRSLTPQEIRRALLVITKIEQVESFGQDINHLKTKGQVQSNSRLAALAPFLDDDGLLRVGGRLQFSELNYDERHPIILDGKRHLTTLLYRDIHLRLAHAGVQHMMCQIRENFWPVKGKNMAKSVVRECTTCFRAKPVNEKPQMGILPETRVTRAFPFQTTGVDYAGPFLIKNHRGRGAKTVKCYLALFVCFATKAIHMEVVSDLSTQAFIAALKRFIARRGRPSTIHSDNATNFVGTNRELGNLLRMLEAEKNTIADMLSIEGVTWEFIPPNSPHFGGIWEAGVKSAKFHVKRLLNNVTLTFEEFYTFICQIEAILNSRPLTPLSDDPRDLEPLTPSHFLIGRKQTAIPEPSLQHIPQGRLSKYQYIQQLIQSFWTRWSHEYLQQLQIRKKWKVQRTSYLQVGDIVLMREDNQPPLSWSLGRVVELHHGPDQAVRVATIRTQKGVFKRAVTKLYPLPSGQRAPTSDSVNVLNNQ